MSQRSPLLPIFLVVLVDILGLTLIMPLLPFYAEKYGATPFVVGTLISTYAACQLISGPILGRISDRVGRKRVLLVSQVGTCIGFVVLAEASTLWVVFVARVIDGVTAGNLSIAQAYVADVTEPKNRAKAFGIIGVAFGIGFLIGPAVSGYLSHFGYHYPVYAAAGLSATSILVTFLMLPDGVAKGADSSEADDEGPPPPAGRRLGLFEWNAYLEYFRRPVLSPLLLQFFCFVFAFSMFTSGFALFAERRFTWDGVAFGPRQVGYVFAYVGFLGIILQGGLIGRLVKRFGETKLVVAGFLSAAIGYAALGFVYSIPMLLAVATVASFGSGVLRPALTSLVTQAASRKEQGVVLGLTQSLSSVTLIVAPLIAGGLIEHGHLEMWALAAAASFTIGFLIAGSRRNTPATAAP